MRTPSRLRIQRLVWNDLHPAEAEHTAERLEAMLALGATA